VTSSRDAVERSRLARLRSIELRHQSRDAIARSEHLIALGASRRLTSGRCWFIWCRERATVEGLASIGGLGDVTAIPVALCATHAAELGDGLVLAPEPSS
jgi:hypothetical protein